MRNLKDRVLLKLAGQVADERHTQAESHANEVGLLQAAQKRMQSKGMTVFTGHGVEFIRVPGEEKFRCRLTKNGVPAGDGDQGEEIDEERETSGDVHAMDAVD